MSALRSSSSSSSKRTDRQFPTILEPSSKNLASLPKMVESPKAVIEGPFSNTSEKYDSARVLFNSTQNANQSVFEWSDCAFEYGNGKPDFAIIRSLGQQVIYKGFTKAGKPHGKGVYFLPSGGKVKTAWDQGVAIGKAKIKYSNGDRFKGIQMNLRPNGAGKKLYLSQWIISYKGNWKNGLFDGVGKMLLNPSNVVQNPYGFNWLKGWFKNGAIISGKGMFLKRTSNGEFRAHIYKGEFREKVPHGQGSLKSALPDQFTYQGGFENGKMHGFGTVANSTARYEGEFANDRPHGEGKLFRHNGTLIYEGYFAEGKKEGFGCYYYMDGGRYEGSFTNDRRHGQGKLFRPDGRLAYEGDFAEGKKEGFGREYDPDGTCYEGQYLNNKQHGKGKEFYPDGALLYEGDFVEDRRQGQGHFVFENGDYYIGEFADDCRNGTGTLYAKDGTVKSTGQWKNKELISS